MNIITSRSVHFKSMYNLIYIKYFHYKFKKRETKEKFFKNYTQ